MADHELELNVWGLIGCGKCYWRADSIPPMRQSLQVALGKAIRRLRAKAGFSQEGFAAHCKLHRTYMGGIERGTRNVSIQNIERIARGLGLTAGALLLEAEKER